MADKVEAANPPEDQKIPDAIIAIDSPDSLNAQVEAAIVAGQATIKKKIVDDLANEEIARRKGLVVQGLKKLAEAQKESADAEKPDQETYTATGEKIGVYSKQAQQRRVAAKKKLDKIVTALKAALRDKPDYKPLEKLLSGKKDEKDEDEKKDGDGAAE
jgi:hypothetical protein